MSANKALHLYSIPRCLHCLFKLTVEFQFCLSLSELLWTWFCSFGKLGV